MNAYEHSWGGNICVHAAHLEASVHSRFIYCASGVATSSALPFRLTEGIETQNSQGHTAGRHRSQIHAHKLWPQVWSQCCTFFWAHAEVKGQRRAPFCLDWNHESPGRKKLCLRGSSASGIPGSLAREWECAHMLWFPCILCFPILSVPW